MEVSVEGEVMMDYRLISDALERGSEQARQGHIALLILHILNGRYTVRDSRTIISIPGRTMAER